MPWNKRIMYSLVALHERMSLARRMGATGVSIVPASVERYSVFADILVLATTRYLPSRTHAISLLNSHTSFGWFLLAFESV